MDEPAEAAAWSSWAEHYDFSLGDRAPYVDFYRSVVAPDMSSLVDIGCGTGIVTAAVTDQMASSAHGRPSRAVGVDGSSEMLRIARRRRADIEWIQADMRDFQIGRLVDFAFSSYNTLQHLDLKGLAKAFLCVRGAVAEGGIFAFDIYQPNVEYLKQPQRDKLASTIGQGSAPRYEIREDTDYDEESRVLTIDWRLVRAEHDLPPLSTLRTHLWQHFPFDVERLLLDAGFRIQERYGGLDRSPFDEHSKKQVTVCVAA
jgi:SAM-dependent methyltransferase